MVVLGRDAGPARPGGRGRPSGDPFSARAQQRRRRRLVSVVIAASVLLLLLVAAALATVSPWVRVEVIEVRGHQQTPAIEVLDVVNSERGQLLLFARTDQAAARVQALPLVRSASVQRRWPSRLIVTVQERQPAAVVGVGRALRVVDIDGVELARVSQPPPGLPRVELTRSGPASAASLRACLQVLHDLPAALREEVTGIGADSPQDVWLRVRGGAMVRWGDTGQPAEKVAVLQALRTGDAGRAKADRSRSTGGITYDVRAPAAPAVRRP